MSFESFDFNREPSSKDVNPPKAARETFGYDSNPYAHLMKSKNEKVVGIPINEDERGGTVIHDAQAKKAAEFLKKYGSDTDGLTLQ